MEKRCSLLRNLPERRSKFSPVYKSARHFKTRGSGRGWGGGGHEARDCRVLAPSTSFLSFSPSLEPLRVYLVSLVLLVSFRLSSSLCFTRVHAVLDGVMYTRIETNTSERIRSVAPRPPGARVILRRPRLESVAKLLVPFPPAAARHRTIHEDRDNGQRG